MKFDPSSSHRPTLLVLVALLALAGCLVPAGLAVYTLWGASSLGYELTPEEILISFGPSTSRIDRASVERVEVIEAPAGARRIVGTSIPGLYQGRWSLEGTGSVSLYATSLERLVVIETPEGNWGISPEDPGAFMAALEAGETGSFAPAPRNDVTRFAVLGALPLVIALVVAVAIFRVLRIGRRIHYELTSKELLIHGGRTPIALPYRKIKSVQLAIPAGRPLKSFAISTPGLYWGSFRWPQAAPNLKLHATQLRPLVLVECGETTYGLSPEKAEKFVAALKERLAR